MLTPEEIQSREFLVSLRGYDRDEVHAFLDEVAADYAELLERGAAEAPAPAEPTPAAEPVRAAEPEARSPFAAVAAETQRILEAAHEAGQEIRARAEREASAKREGILEEAEVELEAAATRRAEAERAIAALERRRDELFTDLGDLHERLGETLTDLGGRKAPSAATAPTITPTREDQGDKGAPGPQQQTLTRDDDAGEPAGEADDDTDADERA